MPNSERLFRDADGAALERVARLEDENRRLRGEIERLRDAADAPGPGFHLRASPPHPLNGKFFVLAMALPLAMLTMLVAVAPHHHARICPYDGENLVPQHRFHGPYGPVEVDQASATEVRRLDNCSPPYTFDGHGLRKYKRECIP